MNAQEVAKGKGFPNNPAIIQDVRITGKESIAALRSKENHFSFLSSTATVGSGYRYHPFLTLPKPS